ncbi:glycerol-3-phosphate dehydrogenase [Janthinobacterium sp. NFX145]|uniref:glycerol-3-phosphate dehydrogenase n=1 Tax=Janthinobacterium sp. NFX145 TaxID=3415602 RepID=UPI003CC63D75
MAAAQQGVETAMACDVLVVGGGINGAGIARDAAGRGLSVLLCEKDDLAAHTSSASTKLIHGGLRYLEYYEFGLVRKALIEREVLLRSAPHIMWPLRFVMPHAKGQRPAWLIRAGLFLYDMLAKREILPASSGIDLTRHAAGQPLKTEFKRGFVYSDGWVDDARLVVLNAIDAADKGAHVLTRTRCTMLAREGEGEGEGEGASWLATLQDSDGKQTTVRARSVVNAAGPWTAEFLQQAAPGGQGRHLRLIKGSHIVVKRLFAHDHAYIFQHPDGRIVFAIPYEHDFTLIGTTDLDYQGDRGKVEIDDEEIRYLCELSSYYFSKPIVPADVVWTYAGVRPLVEDAAADAKAVTRDYRFELDQEGAPLLSIFGGKITTFRKLAEEAMDMLAPLLGNTLPAWTASACLPGGDVYGSTPQNRAVREFGQFVQGLQREYAWLPAALVARYARAYGTRIHVLLDGRADVAAMGEEIAAGLYAAEVDYMRRHEWAVSAADILWRRSKLGLHLPRETADRLDAWLLQHPLS